MNLIVVVGLFVALAAHATPAQGSVGLGDRLLQTFGGYNALPLNVTEAKAAGWQPLDGGNCDPNLGIRYNRATSPDKEDPLTLSFNAAGQIAGVDVSVFSDDKSPPLVGKYWLKSENGYHMTVMFRINPCESTAQPEDVGSLLLINPGTLNYSIPTNRTGALSEHYNPGACFAGMGYHHFKDLSSNNQTYNPETLLPVIPMYNGDEIQAIFFAVPIVQQGLPILPILWPHGWERIPLPSPLMCKNWCDSNCHWDTWWSTMHFYFKDIELATCPNGCTLGCCEK